MKIAAWFRFATPALVLGILMLILLTWAAGRADERFGQIAHLASIQIRDEGQLKEAVLRARHGLESDYDRMTALAGQLENRRALLSRLERQDDAPGREIGQYQRLVSTELLALENFKYQNAVVRNSVHYMQYELVGLLRALSHAGPGQDFQHDLTDYANQVLQIALGGSLEHQARTTALGESLAEKSSTLPPAIREQLQLLVRHGRIITQNLPLLQKATTDIVDSGTRRALVRAVALATEEIRRQEETARVYRLLLAASAGLMLFALAAVGRRYLSSLKKAAQQRGFLQTLMDHAGVGILVVGPDDRVGFANPEGTALLGYEPGEIAGVKLHGGLHTHPNGEALSKEECFVTQALRNERKWVGETQYRKKDGSLIPVLLHAVSLAGSSEQGMMLVMQDITELKKARAELLAQQQHLEQQVAERTAALSAADARHRAVVENAPDGFLVVDGDKRIVESNPSFQITSGYSAEELKAMTLFQLDALLDEESFARLDAEALARGYTRFESRVRSKNGRTWPVDVTVARWPEGGLDFAFVRDITERQALDEAREAARQEAERLARVKSEFLANMSHEIRTPLNGVLGLAQIGLRDSEGGRVRETFSRIIQSGKLLLGVINDILDFSKIEAGRLSVEHVPVSLPKLLRESIQSQESAATARGISLRLDMGAGLPESCLSDPLRLAQILANLLSNAIKFTPAGGVSLHADVAGDQLFLSVSDTGIGMTPEQVSRMFTPFEQADGSTTRKFGGTGLGLTITQRLVKLLGGEIRVESQPGQGSRFEVRLPLTLPSPVATPAVLAPMLHMDMARQLLGLSILVAEDDEINRMVLEEMLVGEGARVSLATNGLQAIDRLIREGPNSFDVVLMDVQMPEMDGFETTRRIRQLAPTLPVIGHTAHALADERQRCLASGMVDHLAKPVDMALLIATILRHVA